MTAVDSQAWMWHIATLAFFFFPIIYGNVCIHKLALSYTISKLPSCIDNVPYKHIKERVYMKQHVRSYTKSGHLNNSSYIDIASLKANKSSFNYLLHVNHRKLSKHSNHIQWYFMLLHISPMWYTCKIVEITFFLLLQSQMFICTWNEIIHKYNVHVPHPSKFMLCGWTDETKLIILKVSCELYLPYVWKTSNTL